MDVNLGVNNSMNLGVKFEQQQQGSALLGRRLSSMQLDEGHVPGMVLTHSSMAMNMNSGVNSSVNLRMKCEQQQQQQQQGSGRLSSMQLDGGQGPWEGMALAQQQQQQQQQQQGSALLIRIQPALVFRGVEQLRVMIPLSCQAMFRTTLQLCSAALQNLSTPYKCPACSQNNRSNAGPSSSSQAPPATPEKQVPQVQVTIEKGPTPADSPSSEPVYHAHSSGPGVPGGLKFHQYVRQAAATAHSSQGTSSNPINVSDDEDLSQLLSDPVVAASIGKVSGAFYKAHPEVAAQLAARTHGNAAAAADQNELAADVPAGAGDAAAGDVTSDSPAK
ncbi:hypothetical protein OEZ86_007328 [Tetradesmus obliquus]|nr:hypothetical protein OEZ86_007328 [Tetradesmus obliquus]